MFETRGILSKFIKNELRSYSLSSVKGFRKPKFAASLYALMNVKQRILAVHLGVTHGTLRNWNIEKRFSTQVKKNELKFIEYYIGRIKEIAEEDNERTLWKSLNLQPNILKLTTV